MMLSLEDIKKSIPQNALSQPDSNLQLTRTEWRWRFFNFNGRQLIEISWKEPNTDRVYVDNTGRWINYSLDKEWEKYITNAKYFYV